MATPETPGSNAPGGSGSAELARALLLAVPGSRRSLRCYTRFRVLGPGGITLFDLIDLGYSIVHGRESDEAYATAIRLLRLAPQTSRLWEELEQMGRDAGLFLQYPRFAVDVLRYHNDVDRLLESALGARYDEWIRIVLARLARGEAHRDRLAEVREKLI